jgi:hypothetical protein
MKRKYLIILGVLVSVTILSLSQLSPSNQETLQWNLGNSSLLDFSPETHNHVPEGSVLTSADFSPLSGGETAFYGMATNESIRNLVGYADYVVVAHALYDDGETIKDNVRYLASHGVKVILDTSWWDVWPFYGVVNRYSELHFEDLAWGMNGTESVKYRIRNCVETIGSEYIWGVTIDEEVGDPDVENFPWPLIAWYQNLFCSWMHSEYPEMKVFAWPAASYPEFVSNYMYRINADGVVYDNYDQNITRMGEIASFLKSEYPDGPVMFIVSAAETIGGWTTCHPPTYLKRVVPEVLQHVDVVGFWTLTENDLWGWEDKQDDGYQLALRICNQIHLSDWHTIYGNTEWFECGFGNDTVTENLSNWNTTYWYEMPPDSSSEIDLSTDKQVGSYSINLTCVNPGVHSYWWQFGPSHYRGYPDWADTGPYGAYNLSEASRITFWIKGNGWDAHPEATVRIYLEKSNYPAPPGKIGNLTLPDIAPYLSDGQWHQVSISLPLSPSAYCEWDGYASQVHIEVDYDHSVSGDTTSILLDGWHVDSFDTGKVLGLSGQSDCVRVDNGTLMVEGSAFFEFSVPETDSWYYEYWGTGQILMCINGTWTAPPDEGMLCYWNLTGVRLFNGSFDWIKVNEIPPLVEILSPSEGDLISGVCSVQVNATDESGINRVEFTVDGILQHTDWTQPFSWDWNTAAHGDGLHRLNATAYAISGSVNFYHVQVRIDNTIPILEITSPLNQTIASGTVEVGVDASDTSGIQQVRFYVDNALLTSQSEAPFGFEWDTTSHSDGSAFLMCAVTDNAGNENSATHVVTVDNTGPLLSVHSISIWGESGIMAVNTSDPSGIERVEFYLDGILQYTDYAYPYQWSWSGVTLPDGSYTFMARSYDTLNHSSLASSGVQIDNTQPALSVAWTPSGTTLSGVVDFEATANDSSGIAYVEFYLHGALQYTDYLAPYGWTWDTSLVADGNHSLMVVATDSCGNSKYVFMNLVVDNTGPSVTVNNPTNGTVFSGPSLITVRVTILDISGVDSVLLDYYTGTSWIAINMVPSGSYFEAATPVFPENTIVLFRVFANDSLGNSIWSSTYSCFIVDLTPPSIDLELIPSTSVLAGIVQFDVTALDTSGISMVVLYVDSTQVAVLEEAPFEFLFDTRVLSDGFHIFRIWSNDTYGNSYYIDGNIQTDNSGPIAVINSPIDLASLEGPTAVSVFGTAQDENSVDTVMLSYSVGETWTNVTMAPSGQYFEGLLSSFQPSVSVQLRIYANDTLGNWGVSTIATVYIVDTTQPTISASLTPNWSVLAGSVNVLATVTDVSTISTVLMYVDGSLFASLHMAPYLYALDTGVLPDGPHTLRLWANDTWDNSNHVDIIIQTDNSGPVLSVSTPVNGTVYDAPARVCIEASVSDPHGLSYVLVLYCTGGPWISESLVLSGSKYIWNSSQFASGTVLRFMVFANDTVGNEQYSGVYECSVMDLSGPTIGTPAILPKAPTSFDIVTVSVSVSDYSGVSTAVLSYSVDSGPWYNITMTLNSVYWTNIPSLATGSAVSYRLFANDSLNHWTATAIYWYTVVPFDILPPDIMSSSWTPSTPDDSQAVTVSVNATDPSGVAIMILAYHDGSSWRNITMVLSDGKYIADVPSQIYGTIVTLKVYCCDGQNNWGVTPLGSYSVTSSDLDGPEVVLLNWSPLVPTEEDSVTVYIEISDVSGVCSVILCYGQGTALVNVTMTFNGTAYIAAIRAYPIGAQVDFCVYSCDNHDNWAVGEWSTYTVSASDITPPTIGSISWSPSAPLSNESIDVFVTVSDENRITLVLLEYFDGLVWRNLTMTLISSSPPEYVAQLPALGAAGTIQLQVFAWDSKGNLAYTGIVEIEVKQVPPIVTTTTTTSVLTTPDTLVIAATGAIVVGLPIGIVIGLLPSLLRRKRGSK